VVHWGYAQVECERVTILAELAESVSEIDIDRAKLAESKARDILSKIDMSSSDWESEKKRLDKYEFKLKRALVRQQAAFLL
jgi:F0F1-type ATP synthase, epsilon subunit (mitochondrial delta subunit)